MSFLDSSDDLKRAERRPLLFFILATLIVGAAGSVFTEPNIATWYAGLVHPSFAPPNWLFAPVWTTLYVVMAVAAWRVWRIAGTKSPEMAAYVLQLIFNFAWSAIFFAAHQIGLALVEIGLLLALILATTILFWRRDRLAGLLFLPYLAWTVFAAFLNHAFWSLNP
ncbi:MAG: TspO/MBR family protein [Pseudomonadota bacterium]